jgi:hypothetical protein
VSLLCLFAGWREHKETHGWLRSAEDMYGVPHHFISYEIVRYMTLNSSPALS